MAALFAAPLMTPPSRDSFPTRFPAVSPPACPSQRSRPRLSVPGLSECRSTAGSIFEQIAAGMIDLQGRVIQPEALVQDRLHVAAGGVTVAVGSDEHVG